MIPLIRLKDRIVQFVGRYEIYVMAAFRFVVAYFAFHLITVYLGYMDFLSDFPISILLALLCCFLPSGVMVFCAAVLILLELYALSMYLCLIVGLIFLIMFCAYMRFTSRKGMYTILTPVLSVLGVPYTMPVASGLLGEPYAVISVICGEVTYFIIKHVTVNFSLFVNADDSSVSGVITFAINQLLMDQEMYLYLIGFAAAAIVTFCIRKLPVRQSHLIAAAIGIVTQIAIIGGGEVLIGNQRQLTSILLGCVVSFLILMILSFFTHNLDYRRVENVQFEDDDYYYYVRAIPKTFAPLKKTRTVRRARPEEITVDDLQEELKNQLMASEEAGQKPVENPPEKEVKTAAPAGSTTPQLAAEAQKNAAAAEAAERAAAAAVAERAAAAAQAISEAAGQTPSEGTGIKEGK